jgi:hypothetical protein
MYNICHCRYCHHSCWQSHQIIVIILPLQADASNRCPSAHEVHISAPPSQVAQSSEHGLQESSLSTQNPALHSTHTPTSVLQTLQSVSVHSEIQE